MKLIHILQSSGQKMLVVRVPNGAAVKVYKLVNSHID